MLDVIDLKAKKNVRQIQVGEKPAGIAIDKKTKLFLFQTQRVIIFLKLI